MYGEFAGNCFSKRTSVFCAINLIEVEMLFKPKAKVLKRKEGLPLPTPF